MQTPSKEGSAGKNRIRILVWLGWLWLVFAPVQDLLAQDQAEGTFVLSPRVGLSLDSVEVEYFSIFPELDGVKSVVYRKDGFGNLQMLVSLHNGRDTTLTYSSLAIPELQNLINRFEEIPDNPGLVKWNLLQGLSPSRINYFENIGRKAVVYTLNSRYEGRLLTFGDSALYLWLKPGGFRPGPDWMRYVKRIPADSIRKIRLRPNISSKIFGASMGAGVAVGLLGFGYNATGASDFLFSANSLLLLGLGTVAGSVAGLMVDGALHIGRVRRIDFSQQAFGEAKARWGSRAMFNRIYPPELQNLR